MLDRGGINNIIRLIHTIVNQKLLHHSRGHGGSGAPPVPPVVLKNHKLDPDAGPHTGALTEDDVGFDDGTGHDHQGASDTGKKVDHTKVDNVTADQHHPESHAPDHKDGGAQALDVKELVDSEGRLLTGVQKTDLTDGGLTLLHGHGGATTGAVQIILTNETGGERSANDVVVTDPDHDESFIGTSGSPGYQGKVLVVAETIASSGSGLCWERGGPFNIEVVGAVDRNDGLRTSATIYKAEAAEAVVSDGVFAIALSTSGSGGGTIKAVFLDVISEGGGAGTIEIQEDDAKVADADVVNFEGGGGKVTDEGGGKVTVDITPGAGGGGGAWTLIEDVELGAPAATIDFQNIPDTYKHLAILFSIRGDRDEEIDVVGMRFNNDAGANYDWARHRAGSIHQNDTGFADTAMEPAFITGATSPADAFGGGTIYIYDYTDTAKRKDVRAINAILRAAAHIAMIDGWGEWHTTDEAITRITLFPTTGPNFAAGSRATLYGIGEGGGGGSEVGGCHGVSYPISNQTINEGATYTSGDLRDGTVVPADAVGLWLMITGTPSVANKVLCIDSADDVPDAYSSRLRSPAAAPYDAMVMVRLGTGANAGKIKIKALSGNWTAVYAWPVGYWK